MFLPTQQSALCATNRWIDWHFYSFIILKKREAKVGRGGRDQETNLSSSDKKFTPPEVSRSVTPMPQRHTCTAGYTRSASAHPTPAAIVRGADGPTSLLAAHPRLTQQATAACGGGTACVCVSTQVEKGKDSKSLQRHI